MQSSVEARSLMSRAAARSWRRSASSASHAHCAALSARSPTAAAGTLACGFTSCAAAHARTRSQHAAGHAHTTTTALPTRPPQQPHPSRAFHSQRPLHADAKKRDYYEVLGVSRTADKGEIKKAFYSKAKQFHPDTNKAADAQSKFAEINNAYEILSDPEKRKRYDLMGHDAEQMGAGGPGGPGGMGFNPEDVFRDFFGMGGGGMGGGGPFGGMGGGGGEAGPQRGADVETTLNLSFMEAVQGTSRTLNVMTDVPCTPCNGSGAQPKSTASTCTDCGGKGTMRVNQGFFTVQMTCRGCNGRGKKHPPCHACQGEGVVKQRRSVEVVVPAGADSETVLRLNGQGDAGRLNGGRGHIFVKLNVGQHPLFKRDGFDVHYDASISMAQAALGTSIPVPTLSGEVLLKVSPGTQPGEKRIMRGKGIKMLNRQAFGDQYVHFKVNVPGPNKLNKRSRELLEQFAREQGEVCNWTTPDPAVSQSQTQPQTNSQSQAAAADAAHAAHSTAADAAAASASSTKSSFAASFGAHHKKGHKAAAETAEGSAAAVGEEAAKESPSTAAGTHAKEGEAKTNETNEEGKEGKKGKKKGGVFGSLFK